MTRPLRPHILLIDDNVTNLRVAVEHLKAHSYEILTASNGEAGVERARLAQPDLILLDIKMPGIDGLETCRRLKANPDTRAIPIIFMTALGEADDKVRGLELGAVDYITKPIEAAELLARVKTHLTLRDLQQRLQERVRERTAALEEEIAQRQRSQAEKEQLLELLRQQSEQLRQLTQHSLDDQQQRERGLAQTLDQQVAEQLGLLEHRLTQARQHSASPTGQAHLEQALAILHTIRQQTQQVTAHLRAEGAAQQSVRDNPLFKLSTREYEVLQLIAQGKSNADIAEVLGVTRPTVSTYRTRILTKLDLDATPALLKFALEQGLIG